MDSQARTNRISELLARFVAQVKLSNTQSLTDINREAQSVLTRLFRVTFDLAELRNLDISDPNHPAIDLGDESARIGFQITSDPATAKIRETLETFTRHSLAGRFDRIIIYILTQKHQRYDADFSLYLPQAFGFDTSRDILDCRDLMTLVQTLSLDKQNEVLVILEDEFGDEAQFNNAWTQQLFVTHNDIYVAPVQYSEAEAILAKRGIVILSGPPHIGKTETAYELLLRASAVKANGGVRYYKSTPDWQTLLSTRGKNLLLDDPFGATQFDSRASADRFEDLVRLAQTNNIVITTRQAVLSEAEEQSRLGESGLAKNITIELKQEGAYDDQLLSVILEKHVEFALRPFDPDRVQLSEEQAQWILASSQVIVRELRFPHNIAQLVKHHAPASSNYHDVQDAINKAKDIVKAVKIWYGQQEISVKAMAAIATLFPMTNSIEAEALLNIISTKQPLVTTNLERLVRRSSGYLRLGSTLDFVHPSYSEGVLLALKSDDTDFAWDIIRWRTEDVRFLNLLSLLLSRKAINLLELDIWFGQNRPPHRDVEVGDFLRLYVETYNKILSDDFAPIRSSFNPNWDGEAQVLGLTEADDRLSVVALLRRRPEDLQVTIAKRSGTAHIGRPDPVLREMASQVGQQSLAWSGAPDITRSIPQIYAADQIVGQIKHNIKAKDGLFLNVSWHIRLARLFRQLKSAGFPVDTITKDNPLTTNRLLNWAAPYFDMANSTHLTRPNQFMVYGINQYRRIINELSVPLAVEDIEMIEATGREVTGPLLVQPDLSWEEATKIRNPQSRCDMYTNECLKEAVKVELETYYEAYKQTAEMSFPSLCMRMPLYSNFPLQVTSIVKPAEGVEYWNHCINYTKITRLADAQSGEVARVSVSVIADADSNQEREHFLDSSDENDWMVDMTSHPHLDAEDMWADQVIRDIARDVEYVLDDPNRNVHYYAPQ